VCNDAEMEDDAFGVLHHDEHHALDVSFDGLLLSLYVFIKTCRSLKLKKNPRLPLHH